MLWDITQLVNENHMQEWQDTGRNLFRDGFFFTVYTGLKNLCIPHSLTMYPYLPLTGKVELPQTSGLHAEHMLTQNPWKNCDSCPEIIFLKFTVLRTATISTLNSRPWEGKEHSKQWPREWTCAWTKHFCTTALKGLPIHFLASLVHNDAVLS